MYSEDGTLVDDSLVWDAGDLAFSAWEDAFSYIENKIDEVLEQGCRPIILGGDHSITYPVMKAFSKRYTDLSILHIDAHPDLYDVFEDDKLSHACPFARILENGLAKRLVQVGVRTMVPHQREQAERFGVDVMDMRTWGKGKKLVFSGPVYISLDIDALDPAFAPGVSHREPGGLSTRQVIDIIQSVKGSIVGADIVEFNPSRDIPGMTDMVCAKLLKEIAARMSGNRSEH